MADLLQLIPYQELAPGQIGAIRNQVRKALVKQASEELNVPPETLVVRDILPQTDLDWGSNTNFATSEVTTEIWTITTHGSNTGYQEVITSASTAMARQRYVAIFGLRDNRYNAATVPVQSTTLWKIDVGHSIKAIWDVSKLYPYKSEVMGICPSAVIIPQQTYYQIYGYIIAASTASYVSLEGLVVESRGKIVNP